jgi:hypothetical protein
MDDDIIPRFTIRDRRDADILKRALVFYINHRAIEYAQAADAAGVGAFGLSVDMAHEKEELIQMIRDITNGTMESAPAARTEEI